MSPWADLLQSPVMALSVPCLWVRLSYFKAGRHGFPLCVAAGGRPLGMCFAARHPRACRVMHVLAFA